MVEGGVVPGDGGRPGRAERELIDEVGTEVYESAVAAGWIDDSDPAYAIGTLRRAALTVLTGIGLLQFDDSAGRFHPVDPSAANDQLVVPLAQRGSELLAESARWNDTFSRLGHVFRNSSLGLQRSITEIHGLDVINRFIDTQVNDARTEVLSAQPYGRRAATSAMALSETRDARALQRGVSMRTLYQHSARQNPPTREYVAEMTALGAEYRTSDEYSHRLMIFDRHTALIPATESHLRVAVAIHDKSVVAFLSDIFQRSWDRALPFTMSADVARSIVGEIRAMTLRMLVEGHSDAVSAKRLGVSPRTYATYIATLKEEYGVETRFQLGWAMAQTQSTLRGPRPGKPDVEPLRAADWPDEGERSTG